jgi:hypothetical protein
MRSIPGASVINDLQRLLLKWRRTTSPASRPNGLADMQRMRNALLETVKDCRSVPALRLHGHIARAATSRDLWALRADAHDVIARHHCQTVAVQRIRTLESLRQGSNL